MKNRSRFIAISLIATLLSGAALPALAQRPGNVRGAGQVGCGEFLEDRKRDRYVHFYTQWVAGFVSGYNLYSNQASVQSIPDDATIDAYLLKHCRENPLDGIARASGHLIRDLGGYNPPGLKK